ncbi:MAG TPA: elongation factor G [Thermohalobaculum sp.]|nr:elongation factor G [Thermohalobaculum sp.]
MARCFAVLGAANTGKSTLVDRMASLEGSPEPAAPPGETRTTGFEHLGEHWTAIDCPGSTEFLQNSADALLAADAAVICVAPDPDAAVLAAPYLRLVEASGTPAIVFINRIDEAAGRIRDIVAAIQTYATHPLVLRQVPIRDGDSVVGAVDLVSERAWRYREGEPSALVELPPEMTDREQEARADLLEHLSEFDDWLLEELIEDRTPADGPVFAICTRALRENRAIPVLIGSAGHGNGVVRMMKALRHEAPPVTALAERLGGHLGLSEPLVAVGFHAERRRHVGKTVFLRALTPIEPGATVGGQTLGQLALARGDKLEQIDRIDAGAVAAAVKSDHLSAGRIFTQTGAHAPAGWWRTNPPMLWRILEPVHERDGVKLPGALAKLAEDDHGMSASQDPETGSARVGAQGTLHLRAILKRLADSFTLEVTDVEPAHVYRETITREATVHYRHKKQTGGSGQFADVRMTLRPNPRGAGFTFDEVVKGGSVPRNHIPAVEAGAREAMARGPLGFPVVDVGVTLTDGQHHSVDSSDMAFKIAGRQGVHQGLAEATPVLLQPFYRVTFHLPSVYTGTLVPIVSAHRGQVLGYDRDAAAEGWDVFRASLPESALGAIVTELRSATQGLGWFEAAFERYEELYGKEADRVVEERQRVPARA